MNRMCYKYGFEKPNDRRALDLMNAAAKMVVGELSEVTIAYGVSDEYRYAFSFRAEQSFPILTEHSFVFHKSSNIFERRAG